MQSEVLYLCLEDTFVRVQQRLFHLTDEANDHLHFAVAANKLTEGLIAQIETFIESHAETRLVIIDTLQVIRKPTKDNQYAADYNDLSMLKSFADQNELALLVIHHTRKAGDSDVMNTVSGTTGLTGGADSTFVLTKESRYDNTATLCVTGRDIEYQEFKVRFKNCRWELIERTSTEEMEERDIPNAVMTMLDFMEGSTEWSGTASELQQAVGAEGTTPSALGKYLNEHRQFLKSRGLVYSRERTNQSRCIALRKIDRHDTGDADDSKPAIEENAVTPVTRVTEGTGLE